MPAQARVNIKVWASWQDHFVIRGLVAGAVKGELAVRGGQGFLRAAAIVVQQQDLQAERGGVPENGNCAEKGNFFCCPARVWPDSQPAIFFKIL